jgi:aspartyl-tRNA(Asn)/glutamyl-tRNA(Gln) amidotransferase subunit B
LQKTLPKLPDDLLAMLTDSEQYGLSLTDAKILLSIDDGERLDYFQDVVDALRLRRYFQKIHDALQQRLDEEASKKIDRLVGKNAANWVLHELGALLTSNEMAWAENKVSSGVLADIVDQLIHNHITGRTAKQILKMAFEGDQRSVERVIEAEGLAFRPLSEAEYEVLAKEVMDNNPDIVQQIREKGRTGKLMFLVGQMMRQGEDGRIEAQKAEKMLRELVVEKALCE